MTINLQGKKGSTLVLVLLVLAFVVILGTGVIMSASASSRQTSRTMGQQQADYTALSVIDAVIAKILDGSVVPLASATVAGSGSDAALGTYQFTIEPIDDNLFKISANATYAGFEGQSYRIIQYSPGKAGAFKEALLVFGDLSLSGSIGIYGDVSTTGSLTVRGSVTITGDQDDYVDRTIEQWENPHTALPDVTVDISSKPKPPNPYVISQNCRLHISGKNESAQIVFNATSQDLYIELDCPLLPKNMDILTRGNHNVYIFLVNDFTVEKKNFVGYGEGNVLREQPTLYIITDNPAYSVSFTNQSSLCGYIYAPRSAVSLKNNPQGGRPKVQGAVVAASVDINGNRVIDYRPPNNLPPESGGAGTEGSFAVLGTYYGQ